jgi:hypothetical protein
VSFPDLCHYDDLGWPCDDFERPCFDWDPCVDEPPQAPYCPIDLDVDRF